MKIYVAGHGGLVGSAIVRQIELSNQHTWIGRTRSELNLLDRSAVFQFLRNEKPDAVIIAAAKVGGIQANKNYPVGFLSENLQIQTNLIDGAHAADIQKLLFLGSSCIYPKLAKQPLREEYLLTGELEKTNEAYAIAKIAGLKLVEAYRKQFGRRWISAMPTNVYGPGDNYDLENSHVLPALIRKFHEAESRNDKSVTLWGTGSPRREFIHSDDLAAACIFLLENYDEDSPINIGTEQDLSIIELAEIVKEVSGFSGSIDWDASKPDGTPRKKLDIDKITKLGWRAKISLRDGISSTSHDFLTQPRRASRSQ
jgi:GDP-L-fucose synthase